MTTQAEVSESAQQLVQSQRTMVLATADPDPWTAPVYYVCQGQKFFFFSSADSRHVMAGTENARSAAAIFRDSDSWREIEGLQMSGKIEPVSTDIVASEVFASYVQKFPTVQDFFPKTTFDFEQFKQRFRSQLYAFVPEEIFYLNNQAGLGKRLRIELPR